MHSQKLKWSDEFEAPAGTPPNQAFWNYEVGGGGWGNDELQIYTSSPDNAFHDGAGNLVLRALDHAGRVTSARLTTKGKVEFAYGRIECRAKAAVGTGLWSAFWALGNTIDEIPWPGCGEIDILENLGAEPNRVFGTVHVPGASKEKGISAGLNIEGSFAEEFHIFSVAWEPDRLTWQMDGVTYHVLTKQGLGDKWSFDHPFYLILNLAVGGWLGGTYDSHALPSDFTIDYVRWYDLD